MSLPITRVHYRRKELEKALDCIVNDLWEPQKKNLLLASLFSNYLKCSSAYAFNSSLTALRFIFNKLQLTNGDKILLSPLVSQKYIDIIQEYGAIPLFCDVENDSPVINFKIAELLIIKEKPKLLILDTTLGYLPDYENFKKLNITIIEDISHGIGGFRDMHLAGMIGQFVLYSLTPECLITGGQGCLMALRSKKTIEQYDLIPLKEDLLSELNSTLALSQWPDLDDFIEKKKENYRKIYLNLPKSYIIPRLLGESEAVMPWFPLMIPVGCKEVISYAIKNGIEVEYAFKERGANFREDIEICSNARYFIEHTLIFPLPLILSKGELDGLVKVLSTLP